MVHETLFVLKGFSFEKLAMSFDRHVKLEAWIFGT